MEATAAARQLESFSPLDGRRLGSVPATDPGAVQALVDDIAGVQPFWAALPLADRARYMGRAAQVVLDRLDELSELLSREQGKPRTEAYTMELLPTVDSLRWIAKEGPSILGAERVPLPAFLGRKRARHTFEPLGVVGVIAPWNYPWSIPFGEVAIALMAGNGSGAEAGQPHAAARRADPQRVREGRAARGPGPHRARRRPDRRRAREVVGGQDLLHRLGRGRTQGRRALCP